MPFKEAINTLRGIKTAQSLFVCSAFFVLLFTLTACCPPYCGERYGSDYYTPLEITTVPSGNGYVAQINGEELNNIELDVIASEFTNTCTGTIEVTKNFAKLIKNNPKNFKLMMRKNCSMAIVQSK